MNRKKRIAFLGVGRMASALIRAFRERGVYLSHEIIGTHHDEKKASELSRELGIHVATSNPIVVSKSRIVYVCVRPQQVPMLIEEIADSITGEHIVVSIAVGVPLAWLRSKIPNCRSIYHVHPSSMIMASTPWISSVACENDCLHNGFEEIERPFAVLGGLKIIPEKKMDTWAVLVGCAPAIFAKIALEWRAISEHYGLPEKDARQLAKVLFTAIAHGVSKEKIELETIIERVATPNGVTEEGLRVLESKMNGQVFSSMVESSLEKIKAIKGLFEEVGN